MSPLQRASLGFPPPGHWYWQQKGTLRQAVARYGQFGFDPLPYNTDYYTVQKNNNEKNHAGNDIVYYNNLQLTSYGQLLQVHLSDLDNPRPSLYSKEQKVAYRIGFMLLFELGAWHRGAPIIHGSLRRIHHLCFRKAAATWIGSRPFCKTILGFNAENKNACRFSRSFFYYLIN